MLLKDIKAKFPGVDAVVGRVVAFVNGKHVDLGAYVGDGVVQLSPEGAALMAPAAEEEAPKRAPRRSGGLPPSMNSDLGA